MGTGSELFSLNVSPSLIANDGYALEHRLMLDAH